MSCPYCGVTGLFTQHPVLLAFMRDREGRTLDTRGRVYNDTFKVIASECEFYPPEKVCLWRCPNCGSGVIQINSEIVYPTGSGIRPAPNMPENVRTVFGEAQAIANASPRAACALLRVCLERLVTEAGGKGDRLVQKIESLGLTPRMKKLCDACRLVGNEAVHRETFDFSISNPEARALAVNLSAFINRLTEEFFDLPIAAQTALDSLNRAKSQPAS